MLLAAIITLAVGTYTIRLAGVVLRDRLTLSHNLPRLLPITATTLLAALALTSTVMEAGEWAGLARPAGVLVGALLAWHKMPFVVVVVAAAATAALLRLAGVP